MALAASASAVAPDPSPERYAEYLSAFLTLGPRFAAVARRLDLETRYVKRLWESGIPHLPYAVPLSLLYAQKLKKLESVRQTGAITQQGGRSANGPNEGPGGNPPPAFDLAASAIGALRTEAELLQAFRGNLIGAITASASLVKGFERLAEGVAESMALQANNVTALTPRTLLNPLEKFARITGLLAQSTKHIVEMQRLILGAPQAITESRGGVSPVLDHTERRERIARIFGQLQRSGLIEAEASPSSSYAGEETDSKAEPIDTTEVKSG